MASPNQLSFLPEDYLERKARRRSNVICAGLFIVVMGAIGSAFTMSDRGLRDIEKQRAEIDAKYAQAAQRIKEVQSMKGKQQRMARQAELTDSLLERVPRSYLLAEITNSMPNGVSLLDLALDSKVKAVKAEPAKTQFEKKKAAARKKDAKAEVQEAQPAPRVYDVTLRITGIADNDVQVAQFITRLNTSSLLRDVNLLISDEYQQVRTQTGEKTGDKLRRFQIDMALRADAEVKPGAEHTKTAAIELLDE
jgi:Tfp pilus assembly protein PilN